MQLGDVEKTFADTQLIKQVSKFRAKTKIEDGVKEFIYWYKNYYNE